jgi:hypothetical protein
MSNAVKLRKNFPLLLERAGVRRIKIRENALNSTPSQPSPSREKGLNRLT